MLSRENYRLKPDAPGQLGNKAAINTHAHIIFDDWFGDDLVECTPFFLVTERFGKQLQTTSLTGFSIKDAEIEFSPLFYDLNGNKKVPAFKWLHISGSPVSDFFVDADNCLVVSATAYEYINAAGNINNCEVQVLSKSKA